MVSETLTSFPTCMHLYASANFTWHLQTATGVAGNALYSALPGIYSHAVFDTHDHGRAYKAVLWLCGFCKCKPAGSLTRRSVAWLCWADSCCDCCSVCSSRSVHQGTTLLNHVIPLCLLLMIAYEDLATGRSLLLLLLVFRLDINLSGVGHCGSQSWRCVLH